MTKKQIENKRANAFVAVGLFIMFYVLVTNITYAQPEYTHSELEKMAQECATELTHKLQYIEQLERDFVELSYDNKELSEKIEDLNKEDRTLKVGKATPVIDKGVNYDYSKAKSFIASYNGSRIDDNYLDLLASNCKDYKTLRTVVAISVSESGMGRDLPHRESNFWGWFKGGDRNYDPSREVMAKDICNGIASYYPNIADGVGVDIYTGGDRSSTWFQNFTWAYGQM